LRDPEEIEQIEEACWNARRLLRWAGVTEPGHVRIEAIAAHLGVTIEVAPLTGADAQLCRQGGRARIVLAERITDPASRRFSIAHELGHLLLRHPSGESGRAERQANAFAAELLMPRGLLRERCEAGPITLELPRQISAEFQVSIVASAIRVVELAAAPCAVVMAQHGEVKWSVANEPFTGSIPRGKPISPGSVAGRYLAARPARAAPQRVPAAVWVPAADQRETLVEDAIELRTPQTTLSMLSARRLARILGRRAA
jgi:IrrE N-terminal-like domain